MRNPLISGFHPDPSIVRVGDDYYLANSTFEYLPGIPIFHSRDLKHFELLTHVAVRHGQLGVQNAVTGGGRLGPYNPVPRRPVLAGHPGHDGRSGQRTVHC